MAHEHQETDRLWGEAMDALAGGDWGAAEAVGARLVELRHTSGFEVRALAAQGRGDLPGAVAALEEGLAHGPDIWRFWQLLGNCRSDLGDPAGAREAYARALACPGVWRASVELNLSLLSEREGDDDEAVRRLEGIESDPELWEHAVALRLRVHCRRRGAMDPAARHRRLIVHVPARGSELPFFQGFEVVAPDDASALALLAEDIGDELALATIEEAVDLGPAADRPLGVHRVCGGREMYDPDGEK